MQEVSILFNIEKTRYYRFSESYDLIYNIYSTISKMHSIDQIREELQRVILPVKYYLKYQSMNL